MSNIHEFSGLCTSSSRNLTNSEVRKKRNALFDEEKNRQLSFVKRIEKIQVEYKGPPEDCTLLMNKNLSTPYNCAMRKFLLKISSFLNRVLTRLHFYAKSSAKAAFLCHLAHKISK